MTEPERSILAALAGGPSHGHGIVAEVARLSEGRTKLRVGTLYGVLDRLVTAGLIEADQDESFQGRRRRYYRLTDSGAAVRAGEVRRQAKARPAAGQADRRVARLAEAGGVA